MPPTFGRSTDVSADLFDPGLITAADRGEDTPLYTLRYNPASRGIEYWAGHQWEPQKTPKTLLGETRELIGLRDVAASLIASQRDGRPAAERDQLRAHLNTLYDNYVRRHGPLNRFTWVYPSVTPQRHDQRLADAEAAWRAAEGTPRAPLQWAGACRARRPVGRRSLGTAGAVQDAAPP